LFLSYAKYLSKPRNQSLAKQGFGFWAYQICKLNLTRVQDNLKRDLRDILLRKPSLKSRNQKPCVARLLISGLICKLKLKYRTDFYGVEKPRHKNLLLLGFLGGKP
jgi:hypothetical protein